MNNDSSSFTECYLGAKLSSECSTGGARYDGSDSEFVANLSAGVAPVILLALVIALDWKGKLLGARRDWGKVLKAPPADLA